MFTRRKPTTFPPARARCEPAVVQLVGKRSNIILRPTHLQHPLEEATGGKQCRLIWCQTILMTKARSICACPQKTSLDLTPTSRECSDRLLLRSKINNRDNSRHIPYISEDQREVYLHMVGRRSSSQAPFSLPQVRLAAVRIIAPFLMIGSIKWPLNSRPNWVWMISV